MLRIYHNPHCSKSRACLQLLEQANVTVEVVNYLQQPLSAQLLRSFIDKLGLKAMIRDNERIYKELKLALADEETLISAIIAHPQLLQRPIVVFDEQVMIARPPEKILELVHG